MAAILTSLRQSLGRWLRWTLRRRLDLQVASRLLDQPLELLLLILESLPPESAVVVALTCKLAYRAFFPAAIRRLDAQSLRDLLMLLEESVSRHLFFCHNCTQFHRFSSAWAPGVGSKSLLEPPCRPSTAKFDKLYIGFHHVRLVMNAHFFGPGHGLGLRQLETTVPPYWEGWETKSVARIVHHQLYLRITHRILLSQNRFNNWRALRSEYEKYICPHVTTHMSKPNPRYLSATLPTQIPELVPLADRYSCSVDNIEDCSNAPGSCSVCLTDFTTSIRWLTKGVPISEREVLNISIVSYHQLGHCRSPFRLEMAGFVHAICIPPVGRCHTRTPSGPWL